MAAFAIPPVARWARISAPLGRLAISAPPPGLPPVMAHLPGTVVAYEESHVHLDLHVYLLITLGHR
jgi:hypothetical protein